MLTMLMLFSFALQKQTKLFKFKPLNGVFYPAPEPKLSFDAYRTGQYQAQVEPFLKENIGFREPLIRLYNQYLFDFYKKTFNNDIIFGKDHWLYFIQHVNEYYGTEIYRWYDSWEEARAKYDIEAKRMMKLRGVLKDYGVEFFVFMAPQKGFLYPEHLPNRVKDTTTVSAREYFSAKFDEYDFPYIEMTKWFQSVKEADTLPYLLFPETGAHWSFSAAWATDSLMRFMGALKGIELPKLHYGPLRECSESTKEEFYDIEGLANLMRPIPHKERLVESEVTYTVDSTTTLPSALFVGTSFLMQMYHYIPFSEVFPGSQYWYYNSTVYYGDGYKRMTHVPNLDVLQSLLDADYVVWFTEGDQMCKASFNFVEMALLYLCIDEEERDMARQRLIDSLGNDPDYMKQHEGLAGLELENALWNKADGMLFLYPERYFPELAGDSIPTARNSRIPEALIIKDIKRDSAWMTNLRCQTVIHNTDLDEILSMEAQNVLNGRPLMRDEQNVVSRQTIVESLVREMEDEIRGNAQLMESIREKAAANGISVEEQIHADAAWIVNYQIEQGEIKF